MIRQFALGATLLLSLGGSGTVQDPQQCQSAVDSYNAALDEISTRLRRYGSCVSDSQGEDDCSSEFRRLRSAQSDFEYAVSAYQSDC